MSSLAVHFSRLTNAMPRTANHSIKIKIVDKPIVIAWEVFQASSPCGLFPCSLSESGRWQRKFPGKTKRIEVWHWRSTRIEASSRHISSLVWSFGNIKSSSRQHHHHHRTHHYCHVIMTCGGEVIGFISCFGLPRFSQCTVERGFFDNVRYPQQMK